jgi:signal transduction histidine kinase
VLGLGATLEAHGSEFTSITVQQVGEKIRQQAERMSRLSDDLYTMSHLDYDAQLVSRRPIDLGVTVSAALESVSGREAVTVDVPAGLVVLGDRRRVEQVVANLVENALQYGAAPVVVDAVPSDGHVVVSVQDGGPGVPLEVVGELFSKLSLTGLPRRTSMTGLGLALVRGLVEAMGGRVWYEPAEGGGSRFCFTLPTA